MRKAPEAFRTISEAADALDTPAHVLRFWESKFSQVKPVKRAGGRRYYRPTDIDLLSGIRLLLHDQGMTIRGVQKLLQEKGARHVAALAPLTGEALEGRAEPALDIVADKSGSDMITADVAATRSPKRSSPKLTTKPDEVSHTPAEPVLQTSAPQSDAASIQDATATGETPSTSSSGTPAPTVQRPDRITAASASTEQSAGRRPEDDASDLAKTEGDDTEKPAANADDTPSAEGAASEAPKSEHAPNLDTEAMDAPSAPDDPSEEHATVPADASEGRPSHEARPAPALGPLLESAADTTTEAPRFARIAHALRNSPPRSMAAYAPVTARLEALVARMSARAD